jgi:hypothetical protein
MRYFWAVVLAGGLLLIGLDVYEARTSATAQRAPDDGSGMPDPNCPQPPCRR